MIPYIQLVYVKAFKNVLISLTLILCQGHRVGLTHRKCEFFAYFCAQINDNLLQFYEIGLLYALRVRPEKTKVI